MNNLDDVNNIQLLKSLAAQAEEEAANSNNAEFKKAYVTLARGAGLLWRLLDQGGQHKPEITTN